MNPDSLQIKSYITKNALHWPHISDFKGWEGAIPIKYYIDSVPYNFLTDSNGKILLKNTSMQMIKNYLLEQTKAK